MTTSPREVADLLLRQVVAEHAGLDATAVEVVRACPHCGSDRHGRPVAVLAGGRAAPWASLARAGDLVVAVATDAGPVGVDVERLPERPVPGLADVALHPDERAPSAGDLVLVWARKEALLKATGDGLRVDPRRVQVSPPDRPPAVLSWWDGAARPVWMRDLPRPGYAACLAVLTDVDDPRVSVRWAGPAAPARRATR